MNGRPTHGPGCNCDLCAANRAAAAAAARRARVTEDMVNRFLTWDLPKDFCPDCGISFDGRGKDARGYDKGWPVGTNLLTADQARAMLEHVLDDSARVTP